MVAAVNPPPQPGWKVRDIFIYDFYQLLSLSLSLPEGFQDGEIVEETYAVLLRRRYLRFQGCWNAWEEGVDGLQCDRVKVFDDGGGHTGVKGLRKYYYLYCEESSWRRESCHPNVRVVIFDKNYGPLIHL